MYTPTMFIMALSSAFLCAENLCDLNEEVRTHIALGNVAETQKAFDRQPRLQKTFNQTHSNDIVRWGVLSGSARMLRWINDQEWITNKSDKTMYTVMEILSPKLRNNATFAPHFASILQPSLTSQYTIDQLYKACPEASLITLLANIAIRANNKPALTYLHTKYELKINKAHLNRAEKVDLILNGGLVDLLQKWQSKNQSAEDALDT